jgi:AraC family transcriptional regulator
VGRRGEIEIVFERAGSRPEVSLMAQRLDPDRLAAEFRSTGRLASDVRISGASIILASPPESPFPHFSLRDLMVTVRLRPISRYECDLGNGPESVSVPLGSASLLPPDGDLFVAYEEPAYSVVVFQLEADLLRRVAFESTNGRLPEFIGRAALTDPLISQIGFTLAEDMAAGQPGGRFLHESLVTSLAAWLIRSHSSRPISPSANEPGLPPARLRSAIDYIESHLVDEASLFEIAHAAGLSPYHFARLFRKSTGTSPRQFLLRCRVDRATTLIRTNPKRKLSWVASAVGFHDERHLARYFVRFVGCSPAHYRRNET